MQSPAENVEAPEPQSTHNFPESLALSPPQLSLRPRHAKARVRRSNKIRDSLHRLAQRRTITNNKHRSWRLRNLQRFQLVCTSTSTSERSSPSIPRRTLLPSMSTRQTAAGTPLSTMRNMRSQNGPPLSWVGGCVARTINASFSSSYSGSPCSRSTPSSPPPSFSTAGSIA